MSYDQLPTDDRWPQQPPYTTTTTTVTITPSRPVKPKRGFRFYYLLSMAILTFGFAVYGVYILAWEPVLSQEEMTYALGFALFFGALSWTAEILRRMLERGW